MKNAYAFGFTAALLCGGLTLGGCSSNDTGSGTSPADTGTSNSDVASAVDTGAADTAVGGDTGAADTSGSSDSGDASTCGADPTLHLPAAGEGPYCPGLATDGGKSGPCPASQTCCESKKGATSPSSCAANAAACPPAPTTEATWGCDAPSMCNGATPVCCGNGAPAIRTGCTYYDIFPAKGTVCAASCSPNQYTVCEADADCGTTMKCIPMKTGGKQIGFCK